MNSGTAINQLVECKILEEIGYFQCGRPNHSDGSNTSLDPTKLP